jgi:serine/threonine-protein kinase
MKPENIFMAIDDVGDERVKLLDFGVSKLRGMVKTTGIHAMLGTPSYMAPEQASGQSDQVGPWSDVWAMGAILYEMATGRRAFERKGIAETLMMITQSQPDPLIALRADAPPPFVELVDRALSRDPARRLQTIEELRSGLREALEPRNLYRLHPPVGGAPALMQRPSPMPAPQVRETQGVRVEPKRRRWIGIASAIAITLGVGALAIALAT